MKTFKIIFISLLSLVLFLFLTLVIFVRVINTDQYLQQINTQLSMALGRVVAIKHLGVGMSLSGISLVTGPVSIADDSAITAQPFVKIDKIELNLDLVAVFSKKQIVFSDILLQSPEIHVIKAQNGQMNIESFINSQKGVDLNKSVGVDTAQPLKIPNVTVSNNNDKNSVTDRLRVNAVMVRNASVSYIDLNQQFPFNIWLTDINVKLKDFSLSHIHELTVDANLKADNALLKDISGHLKLHIADLVLNKQGQINASGDLLLTDTVIHHFNIIKKALGLALGFVSGIDVFIDNLKLGVLKDQKSAEDTFIKNADISFDVKNNVLIINDAMVTTNLFDLKLNGSIDELLNTQLHTLLLLDQAVSETLLNQFAGLNFLMDVNKRLSIDADVVGVIPHLKYKTTKAFKKKGKAFLIEEGGNILGTILGVNPVSSSQDTDAADTPKKVNKNLQNILKSII